MSEHRIVLIQNPCQLSVNLGRVKVQPQGQNPTFISAGDIAVLALFHPQITISAHVLQALAREGAIILVMDERHTPLAQFLPLAAPSRATLRLMQQIRMSENKEKELLWQQIVKARLLSEASVLRKLQRPGALYLDRLAAKTQPADPSNTEAQGAKHYWKHLFPSETFHREKQGAQDGINARLNFGYAILRAMIARALACAGLNPALGLGHAGAENAFNLADDFIEPYRFVIEHAIAAQAPSPKNSLSPQDKKEILDALTLEVPIDGRIKRLATAIDDTIASYTRILDRQDASTKVPLLTLPDYERWRQ